MATLYVGEYHTAVQARWGVPALQEPAETTQVVSVSGGSAQSAAFAATTTLIELSTDTDCHVLIADNPTATTSHRLLKAGESTVRGVKAGAKVAVIAA